MPIFLPGHIVTSVATVVGQRVIRYVGDTFDTVSGGFLSTCLFNHRCASSFQQGLVVLVAVSSMLVATKITG